jgi:hypothetical protein
MANAAAVGAAAPVKLKTTGYEKHEMHELSGV